MLSRITGIPNLIVVCCIVSVLAFLEIPTECDAMSISPDKIILNANCIGSSQDIQAIFSGIGGFNRDWMVEATIMLDGVQASVTDSFHYCVLHDNLLLSFDRAEIQAHIVEYGLAGEVSVEVVCTFSIADSDGNITVLETLTGSDSVEILAPGKKK